MNIYIYIYIYIYIHDLSFTKRIQDYEIKTAGVATQIK